MFKTSTQVFLIVFLVLIIALLGVCVYYQNRIYTAIVTSDPANDSSAPVSVAPTDTPDSTAGTSSPDTTATKPPVTDLPVTEPPITEPPITEPPVTEPPVTVIDPKAPVICLDPGHGFEDPGAIGKLNGKEYYEKDITLAVTLKLKEKLEAMGFRVVLTHDGINRPQNYLDYTKNIRYNVNKRNEWIKDQPKIDAVISIHCNSSSNASVAGSRYYIDQGATVNSPSYRLMEQLILADRRIMELTKDPTWSQQSLMVLRTPYPSVLVECGFITNSGDLARMLTDAWQDRYAAALADGIGRYFQIK